VSKIKAQKGDANVEYMELDLSSFRQGGYGDGSGPAAAACNIVIPAVGKTHVVVQPGHTCKH
jgi:hypothetical protein